MSATHPFPQQQQQQQGREERDAAEASLPAADFPPGEAAREEEDDEDRDDGGGDDDDGDEDDEADDEDGKTRCPSPEGGQKDDDDEEGEEAEARFPSTDEAVRNALAIVSQYEAAVACLEDRQRQARESQSVIDALRGAWAGDEQAMETIRRCGGAPSVLDAVDRERERFYEEMEEDAAMFERLERAMAGIRELREQANAPAGGPDPRHVRHHHHLQHLQHLQRQQHQHHLQHQHLQQQQQNVQEEQAPQEQRPPREVPGHRAAVATTASPSPRGVHRPTATQLPIPNPSAEYVRLHLRMVDLMKGGGPSHKR
jgi:hypothetical protein